MTASLLEGGLSESLHPPAGSGFATPSVVGPGTLPDLVTMSTAGSGAPRHDPSAGLPPFVAYCITTATRFPVAWLSDFLADAVPSADSVVGPGTASVASALLSRYCAALHTTQNFTYTKRNVAEQKSLFPFGVDEFFLTAVLKMRGPVSADVRSWLFLTLPNGEARPVV